MSQPCGHNWTFPHKDGKPRPGFSQCYQGGNKVKTRNEIGFGFATPAAIGAGKRKGGHCFWKKALCLSPNLHSNLLVAEPVNLPFHCTVAALPPYAESCPRWLPLPVSRAGPESPCENYTVCTMYSLCADTEPLYPGRFNLHSSLKGGLSVSLQHSQYRVLPNLTFFMEVPQKSLFILSKQLSGEEKENNQLFMQQHCFG